LVGTSYTTAFGHFEVIFYSFTHLNLKKVIGIKKIIKLLIAVTDKI